MTRLSAARKAELIAEMKAASVIEAANMVATMLPYLHKLENKDRTTVIIQHDLRWRDLALAVLAIVAALLAARYAGGC